MLTGVEVRGLQQVVRNLQRGVEAMRRENLRNMQKVMFHMEGAIKRNRLSGPFGPDRLLRRSGLTRASVHGRAELRGNEAVGFVGTAGKHMRAQEEGATIRPIHGKYLAIPLAAAMTASGVARGRPRSFPDTFVLPNPPGAVIMQTRGNSIVPLFALVRQVKLPARHIFEKERKAQQPTVEKFLGETIRTVTRVSNGEPA